MALVASSIPHSVRQASFSESSNDLRGGSTYICKMKAEINPKLSDCEREHNSLNRTMHIKVADSRRNRLAQDRDKPRNITPRYDDDSHDSQ